MNITIYSDKLDVEILPAYCNWTLIEAIKFDKKQNTFVEPYLPNHEIGIIHLAGKNNDNIRNNKNYMSKVKTLDGDIIEKSLRFGNQLKKNKFSKNWIIKQKRDIYVKKSKLEGYRSRAVYKLQEINDKFKIIKNNISVIDLGAAPGSWSQYISRNFNKNKIISIDLKDI